MGRFRSFAEGASRAADSSLNFIKEKLRRATREKRRYLEEVSEECSPNDAPGVLVLFHQLPQAVEGGLVFGHRQECN